MDCMRLPGLILGLCLFSSSLVAQHSAYEWATRLTREFGFDDMAEKVFTDLVTETGRTTLEKQQGQLGGNAPENQPGSSPLPAQLEC